VGGRSLHCWDQALGPDARTFELALFEVLQTSGPLVSFEGPSLPTKKLSGGAAW
jgi:hypothetical protein